MRLSDSEDRFLHEFREKRYHPEYLFEDQEVSKPTNETSYGIVEV